MAKKLNIKKAIKKPGRFHKDLGVPQGEKIPAKKLAAAAEKKKGKVGQRARFARLSRGSVKVRSEWMSQKLNQKLNQR